MENNFSVLMSVYINSDRNQFTDCLDSIYEQSFQPDEIILVKDGALNFDLDQIISKYETMNIIIVENEINLGLPKSLNKGLSFCRNEVVFRMDSDDICMKGRFEIQLREFISNKKLAVLGTNVVLINEESLDIVNERKVPVLDMNIRGLMPYKNPFNHPSVVFRKSVIQKVGGYSDLYLYEDWFLWFKLSKLENIEFKNMDQKLLKYRIRTFSDRNGVKIIKAEYQFYSKLRKEGYINTKVFLFNVMTKCIIRILPNFIYKFFKHKFDEVS